MSEAIVVLITGTRTGIGKALAEHYSSRDYRVYGCSRNPIDFELEGYSHICCDVTDENAVKALFKTIRKEEGRLDVLIHNAGVAAVNPAILTSKETIQNILNTNILAGMLCSREAAKLMQKWRWGRIVHLSSIHVPLHSPGTSAYGASKAAIQQYSRVLAGELAPLQITVNVLGLTFVKSSGMVQEISEETIQQTLDKTLLKSWIDFDDVAHAIDFFISPESQAITGQTLYLGGV